VLKHSKGFFALKKGKYELYDFSNSFRSKQIGELIADVFHPILVLSDVKNIIFAVLPVLQRINFFYFDLA
jgi:hypothetical protein